MTSAYHSDKSILARHNSVTCYMYLNRGPLEDIVYMENCIPPPDLRLAPHSKFIARFAHIPDHTLACPWIWERSTNPNPKQRQARTYTHTHIHTYTHSHTHKQTNKQTNKQTSKQGSKQASKQAKQNKQTNKQTNQQTNQPPNQQTNKHRSTHTITHAITHTQSTHKNKPHTHILGPVDLERNQPTQKEKVPHTRSPQGSL